jgi:hypothetical protein
MMYTVPLIFVGIFVGALVLGITVGVLGPFFHATVHALRRAPSVEWCLKVVG